MGTASSSPSSPQFPKKATPPRAAALKKVPTQSNLFNQILKHNCKLIEDSLNNELLSGEEQERVLDLIETNRSYLDAVYKNLRPKYRANFGFYVARCDGYLQKLGDIKYSAKIKERSQWERLQQQLRDEEVVKESQEFKADRRRSKIFKVSTDSLLNEPETNWQVLQNIRKTMWDLQQEIARLQGHHERDQCRLCYFLEESFLRYIEVLNEMSDVDENRNFKYELRAAKCFASDSLRLLQETRSMLQSSKDT